MSSSTSLLPRMRASTAAFAAPNGTVAVYATDAGDDLTLPIRALMTTNARVQFVLVYTVAHDAKNHAVEDLGRALDEGGIRVGPEAGLPLHHFALEQPRRPMQRWSKGPSARCSLTFADDRIERTAREVFGWESLTARSAAVTPFCRRIHNSGYV